MSNQQNIDSFFKGFDQRLQQVLHQLPGEVGTQVVNSALENFENESFEKEKWAPRKDKKNTRPLLIKTGALRRSISVLATASNHVVVGSVLPYASVHNYGQTIHRTARSETFTRNRHKRGKKKGLFSRGTNPNQQGFTFKAYDMTMPRRQFIGATPALKNRLEAFITNKLTNAFK